MTPRRPRPATSGSAALPGRRDHADAALVRAPDRGDRAAAAAVLPARIHRRIRLHPAERADDPCAGEMVARQHHARRTARAPRGLRRRRDARVRRRADRNLRGRHPGVGSRVGRAVRDRCRARARRVRPDLLPQGRVLVRARPRVRRCGVRRGRRHRVAAARRAAGFDRQSLRLPGQPEPVGAAGTGRVGADQPRDRRRGDREGEDLDCTVRPVHLADAPRRGHPVEQARGALGALALPGQAEEDGPCGGAGEALSKAADQGEDLRPGPRRGQAQRRARGDGDRGRTGTHRAARARADPPRVTRPISRRTCCLAQLWGCLHRRTP
ncbi:hypothetical protein RHCRD62_80164 [Rhodococcus sp. RD6.2]|nr:hypothetical protein RHCRD62_80164 [Rhodococcus sp. RD6.2]